MQSQTLHLEIGGAKRDRTVDLLHAMQALSQLSYSPKQCVAVWTGRILSGDRDAVKLIFKKSLNNFPR